MVWWCRMRMRSGREDRVYVWDEVRSTAGILQCTARIAYWPRMQLNYPFGQKPWRTLALLILISALLIPHFSLNSFFMLFLFSSYLLCFIWTLFFHNWLLLSTSLHSEMFFSFLSIMFFLHPFYMLISGHFFFFFLF